MAEIEFTIPTVQYGNIKIRMTPEEMAEQVAAPYNVGVVAATWLNLATQGFRYGETLDLTPDPQEVTGQYQESPEPTPEVIAESNEKLNEIAEQVIKNQLGATTVEPWAETVKPQAKAWDNFDI